MAIITLTTDFGLKDFSVSAIKGAIYSQFPEAKIVDISHQIPPHHVLEASYIFNNAYKHFPDGTIHIIGVDAEITPEKKHIVVYYANQYFICCDNGFLSLICSDTNELEIYEINNKNVNFPTLNIFSKVACQIAKGTLLSEIGKPLNKLYQIKKIQPIVSENQIEAKVIYIDHYKNVITNINKDFFNEIGQGREFNINFKRYNFTEIYNHYNEFVDYNSKNIREFEGKRLALFNNQEMLEIAIYKGNSTIGGSSSLLGISYGDSVSIKFY